MKTISARSIKNAFRIGLMAVLIPLAGCSSDESPTVGFETSSGSGNEGDGKQTILVNLGKTVVSTTNIHFGVAGSAALDGDFQVKTDDLLGSSIILSVPAGKSSATFSFTPTDDPQVESDEVIYFYITSISDESISAAINKPEYQYAINDNDAAPTDGLQVDLTWSLGDGLSINEANFDLYLVNNVVEGENGNGIQSYDSVDGVFSDARIGFESYTMSSALPDDVYYVMIRFDRGTKDAVVRLRLSQGNFYTPVSGLVAKEYVGENFFYGPIVKRGSSFGRNGDANLYSLTAGELIFQKD